MDEDCYSCGEEGPKNGECLGSKRPCGHHCNCIWIYDVCHWCGAYINDEGELISVQPGTPPVHVP